MAELILYSNLTINQQAWVDSNNINDRCKAALQGWGLDKLINDEDRDVRCGVASHGYGLDQLVHDEDWWVRVAVAKQGYGLDILAFDEAAYLRNEVAKQGYGLEHLINDTSNLVRISVAEQGYGLDKLINDSDSYVQFAAVVYLAENNLTLEEWIAANPDKCVLPENMSGLACDVVRDVLELKDYGYTYEDMTVVPNNLALATWDTGSCSVYLLESNNTEHMAESRIEIERHLMRGGFAGCEGISLEQLVSKVVNCACIQNHARIVPAEFFEEQAMIDARFAQAQAAAATIESRVPIPERTLAVC